MNRIKAMSVLVLMIATLGIAAMPATVSAAAGNPAYCDAAVDRLTNQNIQDKVPVILVHGFNGSSQDWGSINSSSSFAGKINAIPGVAVAHLFNYNTYTWVDSPNSGPKLAKTIDCISRLSISKGGKGKVIVVGYSMGGLVARDALSRRSTDNQRAIADEVGQAITIGTPHIGTTLPLAGHFVPITLLQAFTAGSAELQRLPHFPAQTTVHTIAGDVTRVYYDNRGREVKRERPYDDTLVTTISANAEYTIDVNKGGGEKTFTCEQRNYAVLWWYETRSAAPCEHGQLAQNANNGVRPDTIEAIKKYVASLNTPPAVSLTVGSLTTTFDSRWRDVNTGGGIRPPGEYGTGVDTTNGVLCTNCTTTPTPISDAFLDMSYMTSWWCDRPVAECIIDSHEIIDTPAPAVIIGGRTPTYSARYMDSGYQGTSMVWCFETERICLHYRRASDSPQLQVSQALLDVFSRATWSNP